MLYSYIFRPLLPADATQYRAMMDDYAIAAFSATVPLGPSLDWAEKRIAQRNSGTGGTAPQEYGLFVDTQLAANASWFLDDKGNREIGYCVHRDWRGKGLARAAIQEIVALIGIEFGSAQPILASVATDNSISIHLLEKMGFRRFAETTGTNLVHKGPIDIIRYKYQV